MMWLVETLLLKFLQLLILKTVAFLDVTPRSKLHRRYSSKERTALIFIAAQDYHILKMESVSSSETFVPICDCTMHRILEDWTLYCHRC